MVTALLVFTLALSVQETEASAKAGSCSLAPSLSEALKQRFGSSRILNASDLYDDERGLFGAQHRGACPGMTTGRFFGPKERPAIAIVLLHVEPGKNGRLVVARPAMNTWTFFELGEMDRGSTAVVWREGPGTYTGPEEPRIRRSTNDVLVLSAYEAWKRVYIWNGRTFDALQLHD